MNSVLWACALIQFVAAVAVVVDDVAVVVVVVVVVIVLFKLYLHTDVCRVCGQLKESQLCE